MLENAKKKTWHSWNPTLQNGWRSLAGCFGSLKKTHTWVHFLFEVPKTCVSGKYHPTVTAVHIRGGHSSQVAYAKGVLLWKMLLVMETPVANKFLWEVNTWNGSRYTAYVQYILTNTITQTYPMFWFKKTTSSSTWPIRPIPCSETLGVFLVRFLRRCQTLLTVCSRSSSWRSTAKWQVPWQTEKQMLLKSKSLPPFARVIILPTQIMHYYLLS